MRKLIIATAVATLCVSPAFAGPKDQTKDSLIGPQAIAGNVTVNNATTAFSFQAKGCKLQIKAKGLQGVSDGDKIICIAGADVRADAIPNGAGNALILLGEAKSGGLGIKADLTEIGCGGSNQINFNGKLTCYLDDATYTATDVMTPPAGGWQQDCTTSFAAGTVAAPNCVANPTTCKKLKVDTSKPIILGLCQGFLPGSLGNTLAGPTSALIAVRGSRGFVIP
jgi:hypothetical protein